MRYMNPGFKDWGMIIGASSYLTETTDTTKTKTGIAFCNNDRAANYMQFDFPASGETYCRFDFYADINKSINFGEPPSNSSYSFVNGFSVNANSTTSASIYSYVNSRSTTLADYVNPVTIGLKPSAINSVLVRFKWATENEDGYMDLQINDFVFDRIESADLKLSRDKVRITFFGSRSSTPVSNIIISDEPISIKEQLVALPITSVATDMAYDSDTGIYTASAVNQSLLASVDVADLINNFGSVSKVTGVTMVGNPAYRTAEGLSSFTALTKKNNTVTEYGAAIIPADSDSVVANSFKVASDTTIGDLANMQLGLKVGG